MEVLIKSISSEKINTCFLPKEIFISLELNKYDYYELHLGQIKHIVTFNTHTKDTKSLFVPIEVLTKLYLPEMKLRIWKKEKKVYLGPVVGIFINTKIVRKISNYNLTSTIVRHALGSEIIGALCYYFSVNDIDWINKRVKGFRYDSHNHLWQQQWLPIPNVIYDRGTNFKKENKPIAKFIRMQITKNDDISFINNCEYMGKWSLYNKLYNYKDLRQHLPETRAFSNYQDLINMLHIYKVVFFKPFYGSRGNKVIIISKDKGGYRVKYLKKQIDQYISPLGEIQKYINKVIGKEKMIIQQGIPLISYRGYRFDLRVFVIKGRDGKWLCDAIKVRLDKGNTGITNLCNGGELINYQTILNSDESTLFPSTQVIKDFALKVASYLEVEYGRCGELGLDIAIDCNGKLWFIEANTKPDKNRDLPGTVEKQVPERFLQIFEYAHFLAQGGSENEGVKENNY